MIDVKSSQNQSVFFHVVAGLLLLLMAALSGGAALRESVTIDEVAHIGAGLSYVQRLDLRLNVLSTNISAIDLKMPPRTCVWLVLWHSGRMLKCPAYPA